MENNICISKICGLCAGCKNAINKTLQATENHNKVTLFKEIVHNKNVNNMILEKGVVFKENLEDISNDEFVIIRAHGEPKSTFEYLKNNNISYTDCTCVNVKNIHKQVEENSKTHKIVIIGKYGKQSGKMHPEIAGVVGWCNNAPILIEDQEDVKKLENIKNESLYLVCQTTFNMQKADLLIDLISSICNKNNCNMIVNKTICSAQKQINMSSVDLAKNSDLMIVVGGANSSNTAELFANVKNYCTSIFLENIYDFKKAFKENNLMVTKNTKIGLTAGASTMKSELETLKTLLEDFVKEL